MQEREGLRGTPFRRDRALGSVGTSEITWTIVVVFLASEWASRYQLDRYYQDRVDLSARNGKYFLLGLYVFPMRDPFWSTVKKNLDDVYSMEQRPTP